MEEGQYLEKSHPSLENAEVFREGQFCNDSIRNTGSVRLQVKKEEEEEEEEEEAHFGESGHAVKFNCENVFISMALDDLFTNGLNQCIKKEKVEETYGDENITLVGNKPLITITNNLQGMHQTKISEKTYSLTNSPTIYDHPYREHSVEKPFACPQCNKSLANRSSLKQHIKTHTGEKPYSCSQCSYSCSQKQHLIYHMRTHSGEKPYSCGQCGYSCTTKGNLVKHIRIHTGERPYVCDICAKAFSDPTGLRSHQMSHSCARIGMSLTFKENQYNKSLANIGSQKQHMKTHTGEKPYSCSECSYSCSQKHHLTYHMRTHSGEKPFSCGHCSYSCTTKGNLVKHIRIHTGERPYVCDICAKAFSDPSSLRSHQMSCSCTRTVLPSTLEESESQGV